jgi:hypothetical protein
MLRKTSATAMIMRLMMKSKVNRSVIFCSSRWVFVCALAQIGS